MRRISLLLIVLLTVFASAFGSATAAEPFRCRAKGITTTSLIQTSLGVVVSEGRTLAVVDVSDCDVVWTWKAIAGLGTYISSGDSVFVIDTDLADVDASAAIVRIDLATGDAEWSSALASSAYNLTVADTTVVVEGWDSLIGLNIDSGEELWNRTSELPILATRQPSSGVLAFEISGYGEDVETHTLMRLDQNAGTELWSQVFESAFSSEIVALTDDVMLVEVGHASDEYFDYVTYGLDPDTGERLWTEATGYTFTLFGEGSTGIRVMYDQYDDETGRLESFDLATGMVVWQHESRFDPYRVELSGDVVLFAGFEDRQGSSDQQVVMALDSATGEKLWSIRIGFGVFGLKANDQHVYLVEGDYVWAVDLETGEKVWQEWISKYPGEGEPLVLTEHELVVTNQSGSVFVYELAD